MMNEQNFKDLLSIQAKLHIVLMYLERDRKSLNEYIEDIKIIDHKLKSLLDKCKDEQDELAKYS